MEGIGGRGRWQRKVREKRKGKERKGKEGKERKGKGMEGKGEASEKATIELGKEGRQTDAFERSTLSRLVSAS
jgi:hypothetical protein